MSQDERWMGPVVRHGVEARLDGPDGERVTVSLDEQGEVRWGPVDEAPVDDPGLHSFHFWVHANTDSERLDAIQILGARLAAAGHQWALISVPAGGHP